MDKSRELMDLGPNIGMVMLYFPLNSQHYYTTESLPPVFIPWIATFTGAACQYPSQLFRYNNRIKFQPYNFLTDPTSKTTISDANISSRITPIC